MCVCVCPCCRLCCFCPYGGGKGGGDCFQLISKFRTLQSAGRGYLNISLKCGSSFRLSPFCFSFFFFSSPHNVTPSTIKCTFVCVCLWFIYVYFWGLATKCQAKKLRAQNFSFVVVLSTVGDLSKCFSRLVLHLFNNLNRLRKLLFQGLKQSMVHCQMGAIREWEWERDGEQANPSATLSMAWRAYRKEVLHKYFADS